MGAAERAPRGRRKLGLTSEVKHIPEQHQVAVDHSPTFPSKLCGTTVPQPQVQRILCRYVGGASVRQIAKVERRDRATVSTIVKCEQMESYVQDMKERCAGLASVAMDTLEHALVIEKDSRLAYQLLRDVGVIPSLDDRRLATIPAAAVEQDKDAGVKKVMAGLAEIAFQRAHAYGTPLGQMEEDLEKAGGRLDQETGTINVIE